MPYIKEEDRRWFDASIPDVVSKNTTAGELQYCIAIMLKAFIGNGYNYQRLNDAMGALNGANLEFYRRVVAPYENNKIDENGGVY